METKDNLGRLVLTEQDCIDVILNGMRLDTVYVDELSVAERYNEANEDFFRYDSELTVKEDVSFEEFHQNKTNTWLIPDKYKNIDVKEYVLDRTSTDEERERVEMEYAMFKERDLEDVLRLMIFLIEFFRENDIVWGVGRGSSVSSYMNNVLPHLILHCSSYDMPLSYVTTPHHALFLV